MAHQLDLRLITLSKNWIDPVPQGSKQAIQSEIAWLEEKLGYKS